MREELLDIVDENNIPTGEKRTRFEVHRAGLWHRVVHIYYFRKQSDRYYFLVHLRSKHKDLDPGMWDTRFGGHAKAGQDIEEALVCEMKEEIGVDASHGDFLKGPSWKNDGFPNNEFVYAFCYRGSEDLSGLAFKDGEVQRVKWMPAGEIIRSLEKDPELWAGNLEGFKRILKELEEIA